MIMASSGAPCLMLAMIMDFSRQPPAGRWDGTSPSRTCRRSGSGIAAWLRGEEANASESSVGKRARASDRASLPRASEAEGQACSGWPSPRVPGQRLVSFLVSFMYVYLGPSPSNTGL